MSTRSMRCPGLLRRIIADLGGLDLVDLCRGRELSSRLAGVQLRRRPSNAGSQPGRGLCLAGTRSPPCSQGAIMARSSAFRRWPATAAALGNPGYNASKAGLTSYLESLRNRLTRHGVQRIDGQGRLRSNRHAQGRAEGDVPDHCRAGRGRNLSAPSPAQAADLYPLVLDLDHAGRAEHPSFVFRRMSF